MSAEQDLGGQRVSIGLPSKPQGFFFFPFQQESPCGLSGRLEVDIGVTSESFVPSFKVTGRWDPRVLGLGASLHLPTFPCVLLGNRNSLVLQGGKVWGVSELERVTWHCIHDHIAHVGN